MRASLCLIVLACVSTFAIAAHNLSESYPFRVVLNTQEKGGLYELYWTFDNENEIITFAVRVNTTGWVGFGFSYDGQMPNSDVVIGWVVGDNSFFHDRFATGRRQPAIDEQQDWTLVDAEEVDGFTILEFKRKYITCDDKDIPIRGETIKVLWSFRVDEDPTSENIGFDLIHDYKGSRSLNLLGGLPSVAPDPDNLKAYDVVVDNIEIPNKDTTYWCAAFQLPENIRNEKQYITKFSPLITKGNEAQVHHLLIYTCDGLDGTHVGTGGDCDEGVANEVKECRGETLIAGWAVGGEEFRYPDNVALPFGGPGSHQYLVMELHYDNPEMISGIRDSSGIRFHYTSTARELDAGILDIGHQVYPTMIVPPGVANFTITGICSAECTEKFFPEDGIHIFANLLHTHVIGHGLTLQHLRYNSECGVYEELQPIDRNLQYDFNYQQFTHLRRTTTVLPGDILVLKCFYGSENANGITVGGLSTRDEMCLTFPVYYPKLSLTHCHSIISTGDLLSFAQSNNIIPAGDLNVIAGLNQATWDNKLVETYQNALLNGNQTAYCRATDDFQQKESKLPDAKCSYISPNICTNETIPTCCERLEVEGSGMALGLSAAALFLLTAVAIFIK